ncbi:unnamed protein product [Pelagomonas calceolata]|uniref:Uncharacterized protein n=1 Tax=Pelagomonas calceolata TaxID=35677 RepID=A0A8J2SIX7_9STRA|nr:unnamed protein product [Pelagomonas calceolata]
MARLCVILGVCIAGVSAEDNATLPVATTQPHASLPRIPEEAQRLESIVEPPQRSESIVDLPLEPPPPPEPKRTHAPEPKRTTPPRPAEPVEGAWSCARRAALPTTIRLFLRAVGAPQNWRDAAARYVQPIEGPWTWRIADHRPPVLLVRAATGKVSRVACASDDRCARFFTETSGGWRFQATEPVCVRGAALDASDEPPHGWARGAGGALLFIQASALASTKRSRAVVGAVTAAALAAHYADATSSVSIPITWQRGVSGVICAFLSLRCVPVSAIVALLALAAAAVYLARSAPASLWTAWPLKLHPENLEDLVRVEIGTSSGLILVVSAAGRRLASSLLVAAAAAVGARALAGADDEEEEEDDAVYDGLRGFFVPVSRPPTDDRVGNVLDGLACAATAAAARLAGLALVATCSDDPRRNSQLLVAVVFGWPLLAWLASIVQRLQEHRRTKRRFCSPGASTNATRYYLELLRQYLVRNRAELGKLAPHPATSHQRDAEIERFVASGQSLHSYRLTY